MDATGGNTDEDANGDADEDTDEISDDIANDVADNVPFGVSSREFEVDAVDDKNRR